MVNSNEVTVRFFTEADIDLYCDYFFRSPLGFLEGIGLNVAALGSEIEMRKRIVASLSSAIEKAENFPLITVLHQVRVIGIHSFTHVVPSESGVMHAHFFLAQDRGKGVGPISYVKAIELAFKRLNFKWIEFRTPIQNTSALKIKEKLGLKSLGDTVFESPIVLNGQLAARLYRVTPADLPAMKIRVGIN